MKLLILSLYFPPSTSGAATLMHNICKYLPQDSFFVVTASEKLGKSYWGGLGSIDEKFNLPCKTYRLPIIKNTKSNRIMFLILATLKCLIFNIKTNYDCLLVAYPDEVNLFAGYIIYKLTRKPLVVYMHDLYSEVRTQSYFAKFYKLFEKELFSSASVTLVTNDVFRDYYLKRGIKNVFVLNSSFDADQLKGRIDQPVLTKQISKDKLKIVFAGSISATNEDSVLHFLKVIEKINNVEVVFCSPSKRKYLKDLSVGFLSKHECVGLLRSSDVLFLPLSFNYPSKEEIKCAFPIKLLEYLSVGKPILALAPQGCFVGDFIEHNNVGILVNELSENKLKNAVESLRDEKKRRFYSQNALETAVTFESAKQSEKLYTIVQRIISCGK